MPYSFKKLANNWSALSDSDKIALFEGTDYNVPTGAELMALNEPFRVVVYDPVSTGQQLYVNAIPQAQLALPKELIDTSSFATIDNITLDCAITGGGKIRVAVTNDLVNYKVYNGTAGTWDAILPQDILDNGMSPSQINSLLQSNWNLLNIEGGVAFAYVLDITNPTDSADVDAVTFEGTMSDYYRSQVKGTIYDYDYIGDSILRVYIYESGTYKINYKKKNAGGGGGGTGGDSSVLLYAGTTYISSDTSITTTDSMENFDFILVKCDYTDGVDTLKVVTLLKPEAGDVVPIKFVRNSTEYCIAEATINSYTDISIDLLELVGFSGYKVEKILGISGGSGGGSSCTPADIQDILDLF